MELLLEKHVAFTGETCKREVSDAEPWWLKLDIMMFISVDSDCKSRHCWVDYCHCNHGETFDEFNFNFRLILLIFYLDIHKYINYINYIIIMIIYLFIFFNFFNFFWNFLTLFFFVFGSVLILKQNIVNVTTSFPADFLVWIFFFSTFSTSLSSHHLLQLFFFSFLLLIFTRIFLYYTPSVICVTLLVVH